MADREKVISEAEEAIKILGKVDEPTFWLDFVRVAFENALELLKAQEPAIKASTGGNINNSHQSWWYICGSCGKPIDNKDSFCRYCGRAVKWDDSD